MVDESQLDDVLFLRALQVVQQQFEALERWTAAQSIT